MLGSFECLRVGNALMCIEETLRSGPPSENSQHLTDFQGTLEPARDFGLERRGIAAVYAGELTIEEAR